MDNADWVRKNGEEQPRITQREIDENQAKFEQISSIDRYTIMLICEDISAGFEPR